MAELVLFHSALGLRPGVLDFAARLRDSGHKVHTPDLYGGETFEDIEAGARKVAGIGYQELQRRAAAACEGLPDGLVYGGFSNGAGSAEALAATRAGAQGALLMHGVLPLESLELDHWPGSVPVQVHYNRNDPYLREQDQARFAGQVRQSGARYDEFFYPGSSHLFADPGLRGYEPQSARLMLDRVLAFLSQIDVTG